jgi:hypothetical protein
VIRTAKVIDDQNPPRRQYSACGDLLSFNHKADLTEIGQRVLDELGIIERKDRLIVIEVTSVLIALR